MDLLALKDLAYAKTIALTAQPGFDQGDELLPALVRDEITRLIEAGETDADEIARSAIGVVRQRMQVRLSTRRVLDDGPEWDRL